MQRTNPSSAGGVGSARGNIYQKRAVSWWLTRVLTQNTTIGPAFGLPDGTFPIHASGQTEDDVDDIRINFNDGSRLFVQCKTVVGVSTKLTSDFGKSWLQFCRQVARERGSPRIFRCVLCYEKGSTNISDLEEVIKRARPNSTWKKLSDCALTKKEKAAAITLSQLHQKLCSNDQGLPSIRDLVSAVEFHRLVLNDKGDARIQSGEALQNGVLSNIGDSLLALEKLDGLAENLISTRGLSLDITNIRHSLLRAGISLRDIPEFGADLRTLDNESERTLEEFRVAHRNQLVNEITLDRPVVRDALALVEKGSLLVVGQPGVGKTGVLMAVAHELKAQKRRIWFFSVERYEAASLPGLELELRLRHRLADILGLATEGEIPILILDGLDSARDRAKQRSWLILVREAQQKGVLVIASIRLFDLRLSRPWQELFPQLPHEPELDPSFGLAKVRVINVGELSDNEFKSALSNFPNLQNFVTAEPAVRGLARNIFNFSLLCQLTRSVVPNDPIHTQLELLRTWWEKRLAEGNESFEPALGMLVERMVYNRRLRANTNDLKPEHIRDAEAAGFIRRVPVESGFLPDDSFEFIHNLLFDYAAFRTFLVPRRSQMLGDLAAADSWGVFLRPSLLHFFTWLWDDYRSEFWQKAFEVQTSAIPIIHKTVIWFTVSRGAKKLSDFDAILKGLNTKNSNRLTRLNLAAGVNGSAEAITWKPLFRRGDGLWWVEYACELLKSDDLHVTNHGWQILFSLYYEIQHFQSEAYPLINQAARLEVERHWLVAVALGPGTKPCIWLFCRTISGNIQESAKLIRKMLAPEELAASGYYRGHEVAREIVSIANAAPDLVVEIYDKLYGFQEPSGDYVSMGSSAVLPLQISRHDMYAGCRHNLQEGLPAIFEMSPSTATRAVFAAVYHRYVKSDPKHFAPITLQFNGSQVQTSDFSGRVRDLESPHDDEARLLSAWRLCLRKLPRLENGVEQWQAVADTIIKEPRPSQIWAIILSEVAIHPAFYRNSIWSVLCSKDLLSCWRLKGLVDPCVRALASVTDEKTLSSWQDIVLEIRPEDLDRQGYNSKGDFLEFLKSSYLLCLPDPALTNDSRKFLAACKPENIRPYKPGNPANPTAEQRLLLQRRENGLNPDDPLHLLLERDLASLDSANLERVGFSILELITQIDARFRSVGEDVQTVLRPQFQRGFSLALRRLAEKQKRFSDLQLSKTLELCADLLATEAGRPNVLEAIGILLSKRKKLTRKQKEMLNSVFARKEAIVIEHFGMHIWPLLKTWPSFVWRCLEGWALRLGEKEAARGIRFTLQGNWFWWLFQNNNVRALKLLARLLQMARAIKNEELAECFLAWFAAVYIETNNPTSQRTIVFCISKPEIYCKELSRVIRVLTNWLVPRTVQMAQSTEKQKRATQLCSVYLEASDKCLRDWQKMRRELPKEKWSKEVELWAGSITEQYDNFATELRFSTESYVELLTRTPAFGDQLGESWWVCAEPILIQLEKWMHPHFGNHLIAVMDKWFPWYPHRCLNWLRRISQAGLRTRLLIEHLVVRDIIRILQRCLVEHRDLLNSDKAFLRDFSETLEALLSTANADALAMAASMDEFNR